MPVTINSSVNYISYMMLLNNFFPQLSLYTKNVIRTFKYFKIKNVAGLSDQPVGQLKQNNTLHFII
jgi:hypothetical protein